MGTWINDIVDIWKDAVWHLIYAAVYFITANYEAADAEMQYFKGKVQTIFEMVWNRTVKAYDDAVNWANEFITSLLNSVSNLWNSITHIWAQFGAAFLDGFWTVVSWVEDKVTGVTNWVQSNYDVAKSAAINAWNWITTTGVNIRDWVMEKGATVWTWINEKASTVWDWIYKKAGAVWDWIVVKAGIVWDWIFTKGGFYTALFENYRDMLLDFLEDPAGFIADYVTDGVEYIISECVFRFW